LAISLDPMALFIIILMVYLFAAFYLVSSVVCHTGCLMPYDLMIDGLCLARDLELARTIHRGVYWYVYAVCCNTIASVYAKLTNMWRLAVRKPKFALRVYVDGREREKSLYEYTST
jgi:hypothetical protein